MHPANKLANVRRRVRRARDFPHNTCPASRHVHMIAEGLLRGGYHGMSTKEMPREDREWIAGSLYSVLESLWKLRTKERKSTTTA